jgi:hypothetical protein
VKWTEIILSALTAFIIGGGGAVVVVNGSGFTMTTTSWVLASIIGAVSAAQDVRSQLKLPPIQAPVVGPERKTS